MPARGELAIVLHTHMPYVEGGGPWPPPDMASFVQSPDGFGTWPFGEEWLWEAIAMCYLPLLQVLARVPITLSLTPVLCDQLEAPGAIRRCVRFLREIRPESHRRDAVSFRKAGKRPLAAELERSAAEYADAADRLERLGDGLLAEIGEHASWTSAATHAVLPLLATDTGIALQVQTGIEAHRRRFGGWGGGFWLPECAHATWLHPLLEEAGVRATCVELTAVFGLGDGRHLRPLATETGAVLWPIDRQMIALVWAADGYPAASAYRDYHALTRHDHRVWRNDGGVYDPEAARAAARGHARDFVARVRERVRDGGVCVCALDTELLGHWWYEGVVWLAEVIEQCTAQQLPMTTLDDALERHEPAPAPRAMPVTTWGEGEDLRTWSGPGVADLAWEARAAELRVLAATHKPGERVLRELLALQASDWAFLASRGMAADYPRERATAHAQALTAALAGAEGLSPAMRNLAPVLSGWSP